MTIGMILISAIIVPCVLGLVYKRFIDVIYVVYDNLSVSIYRVFTFYEPQLPSASIRWVRDEFVIRDSCVPYTSD